MVNGLDDVASPHPDHPIMAARRVIEQAKGAMMLVYGVDDARAFGILRAASQATNIKVRDLAARVVEELPDLGDSHTARPLRARLDPLLGLDTGARGHAH